MRACSYSCRCAQGILVSVIQRTLDPRANLIKTLYSTLRANRVTVPLSTLLGRAQPLRSRIQNWRRLLPLLSKPASDLTEDEFEETASLRLSHLTVEILIFRALLRPLHVHAMSTNEALQEPVSTIFDNCFTCARVATDIVASLRSKHFTSFWSPCKSSCKMHYTAV